MALRFGRLLTPHRRDLGIRHRGRAAAELLTILVPDEFG